jgi:hypothetical protein
VRYKSPPRESERPPVSGLPKSLTKPPTKRSRYNDSTPPAAELSSREWMSTVLVWSPSSACWHLIRTHHNATQRDAELAARRCLMRYATCNQDCAIVIYDAQGVPSWAGWSQVGECHIIPRNSKALEGVSRSRFRGVAIA